jgi:hypothetical protein
VLARIERQLHGVAVDHVSDLCGSAAVEPIAPENLLEVFDIRVAIAPERLDVVAWKEQVIS